MNIHYGLKTRIAIIGAMGIALTLAFSGCNGGDTHSHSSAPDGNGHRHNQDQQAHSHEAQGYHDATEGVPATAIARYIQIQETLAADSMEGVRDRAEELVIAFAGIEADVAEASRRLAQSADIDGARRHFETVSNLLIASLQDKGPAEGEYFKAHCPMAFENRGASWIQADTTVNNPYYGSRMLRCGEIRETFSARNNDSHGRHHDHATAPAIDSLPEGARTIEVKGRDFAFEPGDIEVAPGEVFALKLVNEGNVVHMWEIEGRPETHVHAEVGQTATGVITAPEEPGVYRTVCTEAGHEEAGMVGRLIVNGGDTPQGMAPDGAHGGHSH